MCRVFSVSRSGYYSWRSRPKSRRAVENRRLDAHIKAIYMKHKGRSGSPKITSELRDKGFSVSKNRVARRMKAAGLRSIGRRKFRATTDSTHKYPVAENLLQRDFSVNVPNTVWVSDITYRAPRLGISRGAYPWNVCNKKNEMPCFSLWKSMSPSGGDLLSTGRVT